MYTYPINFPDDEGSVTMFEDAASAFGWKAQVPDPDGNLVTNPVDPVGWCLMYIVIPTIRDYAAQVRKRRETAAITQTIDTSMDTLAAGWRDLNLPSQP